MKLSIIVPTTNRLSLIQTLESIAKQTYRDFELIVTDDTDGKARDIIERFKRNYPQIKVKYVINQKYVKGPGGNKNNGLDYAEGEFVTIVDDDDELFPEAIETAMKHVEEKDLDVFVANYIDYKGKKAGLSYGVSEYVTYYDFLRGRYDGVYFFVWRRILSEYDRIPDDAWGSEGILTFKILKKAKRIYYLDVPLMIYNNAPNQARVTLQFVRFPKRSALGFYYIINSFFQDFKRYAPKQFLRYTLHGIYFSRLASDLRLSLFFLQKSSKVNFFIFLISLIYFCSCWILPKKMNLFIRERLLSSLKPTIRKFLR